MKRTRFSEEQIVYALKLAESGTSVANVCRKYGISDATFYTWRKKYGAWGFRSEPPRESRRPVSLYMDSSIHATIHVLE